MNELPTTFGKYYLTEKLATGGMAEIYLAKIIGPGGFEKPLVIKQIHPKLSGQRHFVDLFVAEAKTLVTLAHGNIVPVYELGVVDDTYFIAMEYIDGPTLYRLTETMARRDVQVDPAVAAWITARILDGLDYAHRKGEGVIHRDLSPRNVMLSRDGEVKLVDFGIAVTLGAPGEGEGTQSAPTGSFPYMSPEQVRREPLNPQTDLFSVGVLAWEMLAGRRLFARADADATLAAVLREEILTPSSVRPEVPAKLDEVVMRALERDRAARWPTAGDMLAQLNKYLYSLDTTPGPRDVGALVARHCPPETRRLPTHLEALAHDVLSPEPLADGGPGTSPGEALPDEAPTAGPRTAVIPREGAARGRPQRLRTFATNVDMKDVLDRATPLLPFDAIEDTPTKEERPPASPQRRSRPMDTVDESPEEPLERPIRRSRRQAVTDAANTEADLLPFPEADEREQRETIADARPFGARTHVDVPPGRDNQLADKLRGPPSRGLLVLTGFGALALAAAAVYAFFANRDRVLRDERDAAISPPDAAAIAPVAVDAAANEPAVDGAPPPAVDAAPPSVDARLGRDSRDATVRRGEDPRVATDAAVKPTARGTATLRIGAIPWGEIYIDGKLVGRTPKEVAVAAGRHTVEIVFPAETPPRKQTFAVDVANGETKPLQADFTN